MNELYSTIREDAVSLYEGRQRLGELESLYETKQAELKDAGNFRERNLGGLFGGDKGKAQTCKGLKGELNGLFNEKYDQPSIINGARQKLYNNSRKLAYTEGTEDRVIDKGRALGHIKELASRDNDDRSGYMSENFRGLGYEVKEQSIGGYHPGANVIAEYKGDPSSDSYVLVTAHADKVSNFCPGANDNASGSSLIIELARATKEYGPKVNVRFVSFGAEETGLNGSKAYVRSLPDSEHAKALGAINLDSVGAGDDLCILTSYASRGFDGYTEYVGTGHTTGWVNDLIHGTSERLGIPIERNGWSNGSSDHDPLIKNGIPATTLLRRQDGRIPNYHNSSDKPEGIDADKLAEVGDLSYHSLIDMYRSRNVYTNLAGAKSVEDIDALLEQLK
jgi:hypothetical protein